MAEQLLRDIVPVIEGNIGLNKFNVSGERRIVATINGVKYTLSPAVSEGIRSGKIKWNEIGNYYVADTTSKDGEPMKTIKVAGENLQVAVKGGRWADKPSTADVEVVDSESFDYKKYGLSPMDLKATV